MSAGTWFPASNSLHSKHICHGFCTFFLLFDHMDPLFFHCSHSQTVINTQNRNACYADYASNKTSSFDILYLRANSYAMVWSLSRGDWRPLDVDTT